MQLSEFIRSTARHLALTSDTPMLEAQVLAAAVLGKSRSWVLAHPENELSAGEAQELAAAAKRLENGEPLPYIIGHWEFFGLDFTLTPDVLIPRPETELLVEEALHWLKDQTREKPLRVVDVGTGSGCIAVSLAVNTPGLRLLAVDLSSRALAVARGNAQRHRVRERIDFLQSDLLFAVARPFDLICANLPYIPTLELFKLPVYRSEPALALDGGQDGMDDVRRLLTWLPLAPGGLALLEIEASQGPKALSLAQVACPGAEIALLQDLASHDRLLRIERI